MRSPRRHYITAMLLVAFQACTVLPPPRADRSRFFVLTPAYSGPIATASANDLKSQVSVAVGPVSLPSYLERPEMVARVSPEQLEVSPTDRWAEPLTSNFQSVLAQNLSYLLRTQRISMFPGVGGARCDYRVEVRVHRFDTDASGQAQLTASWIISNGRNGSELFADQTTTRTAVASGDVSGAAALSNDIAVLSRQIADRIQAQNENDALGNAPRRF